MAVTEAIEKAVSTLVLEGIKDGIWADIPQPEIDTVLEKLKMKRLMLPSYMEGT
jgi:curli production assembly/transport component CsgG